jgi:ethanolamine utilization protein EutQ (cupin superfamily)
MKYEKFETYITTKQKLMDRSHSIGELGISTLEYDEMFHKLVELLEEKVFSEEQREWIDWFLFERVSHSGKILKAHDAEGNEICYDIKSLWEEITK